MAHSRPSCCLGRCPEFRNWSSKVHAWLWELSKIKTRPGANRELKSPCLPLELWKIKTRPGPGLVASRCLKLVARVQVAQHPLIANYSSTIPRGPGSSTIRSIFAGSSGQALYRNCREPVFLFACYAHCWTVANRDDHLENLPKVPSTPISQKVLA